MNLGEITNSVEDSILKWIRVRKHRLPLFILIVTMLLLFSNAPYINLFFNYYLIILLSVILAPLILDINEKLFFISALILFVPALLFSLGEHWREEAEVIGEYIFVILFSGVVKTLFSLERFSGNEYDKEQGSK